MFISFEGGEGSGKSTQAELLVQGLVESGLQVVPIHEPGSTGLGQHLRRYLKDESVSLTGAAELLLFCAARAQLVAEILRPCLDRGVHVVADRYADSTVAYQGHGRRLDIETVLRINSFSTQAVRPDLTFLLDFDPMVGLSRVQPQIDMFLDTMQGNELFVSGLRVAHQLSLLPDIPHKVTLAEPTLPAEPVRQEEEGQRGFEVEPLEFHRRVRQGYLQMAEGEPQRWVVLDATRPREELSNAIWEEVQSRLGASPSE